MAGRRPKPLGTNVSKAKAVLQRSAVRTVPSSSAFSGIRNDIANSSHELESNEMSFLAESKKLLEDLWTQSSGLPQSLPEGICSDIESLLNDSAGQTYPFALMAQLLGPTVDIRLDPLSIQVSSKTSHGVPEYAAWDARSLAHKIIVPWNQRNEYPLGTANQPYVNNPLRFAYIDDGMRSAQKYKVQFDALRRVLVFSRENPQHRCELLRAVLVTAKDRLTARAITFSPPLRVSVAMLRVLVEKYIAEKSLGLRLQVVVAAIARAVYRLQSEVTVKTSNSTASDAATLHGADICVHKSGAPIILIEVKDRSISTSDVHDSIRKARIVAAPELKIVVASSTAVTDALETAADHEFALGVVVSIIPWRAFFDGFLVTSDIDSRFYMLTQVGTVLNEIAAPHQHKLAWRDALEMD
jgi:hypothetical protein